LIEVSAQHPLVGGTRPDEEFGVRLERGKELRDELMGRGFRVELYVPGSRHKHDGVPDLVSLSSAGTSYLIDSGIPSEVIHGDDLNERYKGAAGVYGSADECFVAASYFKDGEFGLLASVLGFRTFVSGSCDLQDRGPATVRTIAGPCERQRTRFSDRSKPDRRDNGGRRGTVGCGR
jgi:hypothetical protein